MTTTIKDITSYLESLAPVSSQESYDNCGLIVGDQNNAVTNALLTLDCTEQVVDEAIESGTNLIIAHHPIVFKGLKKITGKNYVERTILKAIKNDIAIYAIHTNLDNYIDGVNAEIGQRLGLENLKILAPKKQALHKIVVFVPSEAGEKVAQAMFDAGAGTIGNYSECSFEIEGTGYFKPSTQANPAIGKSGERASVSEKRIEVICSPHQTTAVLSAMKSAHPYEEVAHDVYELWNENQYEGAGMYGELPQPMESKTFLNKVKTTFNCGCIRHTDLVKKEIKRVAFCGGSGSFLLPQAKRVKADIYLTGDFKYHEFFDAENDIIIADIGHYESEQFTPNLIHAVLKKKFINFAVRLSKVSTNPINYL